MSISRIVAVAVIAISLSTPAKAEFGDYSAWQTFWNTLFPFGANNPLTSAERNAERYPLLSNPRGFNDGFDRRGWLQWQTVQLHPSTGAICGNGSPYKFFVNRVAHTSNTVLYFEGGGACYDYESCSGAAGVRGARNPDGIPDNYLALDNPATSLVSPFVFRLHPYSRVKTQDWNIVYVPYCTGDVYGGDRTVIYEDPAGAQPPLAYHHNGVRNTRAILAWLRSNLPRSGQQLVTGCSAGGAASLVSYHPIRRDMQARRNFMINDSGPIFPTEANTGTLADNPSRPLHMQIREVWGLDAVIDYLQQDLSGIRLDNLGTINTALATRYTGDRLGHTGFQQDLNYSSYSYERFYDDTRNAPDQAALETGLLSRWAIDTGKLRTQLAGLPNFGGYFPYFRDVNESHCTSIIDFENGDIQEAGLELSDFINSVLNGDGAVLEGFETDQQVDRDKPLNLIYELVDFIL
ncbi:MAG: pectin acetylesterase-family hydrolase [Pseudomonadota bacterium]